MRKISIIHPSFGRPALAKQAAQTWIGKASNQQGIEYILCLSALDPLRDEYQKEFEGLPVTIVVYDKKGLVHQVNEAARHTTGDLIVAISDDFVCPDAWDNILLSATEGEEDYAIKTQDGLQPFIMTLPIMDRVFYNRFGYIYHPDYYHMYGDEELACVAQLLGKTIVLPNLFAHEHYTTGINQKDEVNKVNDSYMMPDKETFTRRKSNNFYL